MNYINKIRIQFFLLLFIVSSLHIVAQNQNNFEIGKNLSIYSDLLKELNLNYVDEIKPGELVENGINSMLETLDPYTIFISEADVEDYKIITTGSYGGIGVLLNQRDGKAIISDVHENQISHTSGLKAGDIIIRVDGKDISGLKTDEVSKMLKGPAGTPINFTIQRPYSDEEIDFSFNRETIKIPNVPFFETFNDNIGYISISGFTQNAANDVKNAYFELKANHDLKGLILDLRGNGGGLMNEAVDIVNLFVEKGETVVSTKGKLSVRNTNHKTKSAPVDLEIPMIILINSGSASASEIVAGAIQDLDRGVIVGERSFGKGLVQNVVPLSYNTRAKITVAKYYIPSGRCIQAIDYSLKDEDGNFTKVPDSLMTAYKTKNGRTVYDGCGIEPDIKIKPKKFSNIATSLYGKYLIFDYATKYNSKFTSILPPKEFIITDEIINDFFTFISDKDYDYSTKSEKALDDLKAFAEKENYFEAINEQYEALKIAMQHDKNADLIKYRDEIEEMLRLEIVSRYYFAKGRMEAALVNDPDLEKALELLGNKDTYNAILNPENLKTN